MKIRIVGTCLILGIFGADCMSAPEINKTKMPDEVRTQEIKDMKFGMFICWSFSTLSGREWTPTKDKDASYFKVTECDTDQWCETAKAAGMNYILFLTKHHDGFCLWDTATTEKKVTNSPLGIDVLAKLRESCDKYGLKLALYFSEGDWNWPGASDGRGRKHGSGKNTELKKAQLKELLTNYGPIEFWWMDHAVGTGGLSHKETVDWMHEFQPNTFIGFNHGEPAGRLCLREMGKPGRIGAHRASKYNKEAEALYKGYLVAEFTYPILPWHEGGAMWFYSLPKHDNLCRPAQKIYNDYLAAVKYENIFSINIGPNYAGKIRDIDVKTLKQVGEMIQSGTTTQPKNPANVKPSSAGEGPSARQTISLAGEWRFRTDPQHVGVKSEWFKTKLEDTIRLPGTTDEKGVGSEEVPEDKRNGLGRYNGLVRASMYMGKAWYQKESEIPDSWNGKRMVLFLERCHWTTQLWVDDHLIGGENSLCTPHEYDLSAWLTPGKHRLTICVDNTLPFNLGNFASSISKHTQTNWNGIIGRIELRMMDTVWLKDVQVYPDVGKKEALVRLKIGNATGKSVQGMVRVQASLEADGGTREQTCRFSAKDRNATLDVRLPMGEDVRLWNEFTPKLYRLDVSLDAGNHSDRLSTRFGMREFSVKDRLFTVNGKTIYLRGNLECCVFPLTGYPAMSEKEWSRIMGILKSYGLNHLRFHSWCAPEAAFAAADREGVYLQAEAPRANVGSDIPERDEFIEAEMLRINRYYGNHPSFVLLTSGNELYASEANKKIIKTAKQDDTRHLYSMTSGGQGMKHKRSYSPEDQFKVRGLRGIYGPSTVKDHGSRMPKSILPTISHEVGQWAVYPNLAEMKKYKGVLKPRNFEAIRSDLKAKDMLDQAPDFTLATVKHTALLYKEEIEVLLRTRDHAGFQLLALHDYPGQGSAHVGLLDAFWDSKGGIAPEAFRKFCRETVPLLRMPKRTYTSDEEFVADAEIVHYGPEDILDVEPLWTITAESARVVAKGSFPRISIPQGKRVSFGEIRADLSGVAKACKLKVSVSLKETDIENDWEIWCYPKSVDTDFPGDMIVSDNLDGKVFAAFKEGKSVLLLPTGENLGNHFPGRFLPTFWSPTWWYTRKGGRANVSMSILCDPKHPALLNFPTESHSNWQWWDLLKNSNSMILNDLPSTFRPIVRVVDNYSRNNRLANLIEARVGNGKLLVCSLDLKTNLATRPAANQMRHSLIQYMKSDRFDPQQIIDPASLQTLFRK